MQNVRVRQQNVQRATRRIEYNFSRQLLNLDSGVRGVGFSRAINYLRTHASSVQ